MAGERNSTSPEAERRRLRAELATARAGVSRNLAAAENRLQGPLRRLASWRWTAPVLLAAVGGVLVAGLGRRRRPAAGREPDQHWVQSLLRSTLAPVLLRAAVRYVESRFLDAGRRGAAPPGR